MPNANAAIGANPFASATGNAMQTNAARSGGLNYGRPSMAPGGMAGLTSTQQRAPQPLPEINPELQCSPRYLKATVGVFPRNKNLVPSLPLSCVVNPVAVPLTSEDEVPEVNFGACGVIRCKGCRTYINPFVKFVENGRRWRCNNCGNINTVPNAYFCTLDAAGVRNDIAERPELRKGQVEISAPAEYMVRPPQAPVFVFVIDVSYTAIVSGMLQVTVDSIKSSLDNLPGSPRTQVAFLTFDSTVHFYNLKQTLRAPQMIAVSDIDDIYVPLPDDLLVNLYESREVVDMLLDSLPDLFAQNNEMECALGAAVKGAFQIMQHIGGKMLIFQTALPGVGLGTLAARDAPKVSRGEKSKKSFPTNRCRWW
jgi:protein transport protein SEC24